MGPEDDPVKAEFDVYLTPPMQERIHLLQYPNRPRDKPYNDRFGARPHNLRMKPKSGFLELDIHMHTGFNFNKYQSLKWGDAVQTVKSYQNETGTFGPASGFAVPRGRSGGRGPLKDKADREQQISDDLDDFRTAQREQKALDSQTLGGKMLRHDNLDEGAQPIYFLGAFQGNQLHLCKMDSAVQMRPQFHHIDAEDQRSRLAASRAAAGDGEPRPPPAARALQQSYKDLNDDKDKDAPERKLRRQLQDAEEERWTALRYIDEQDDSAYEAFHARMFVRDHESAPTLKSALGIDAYLDAISAPRRDSPGRRRKRPPKRTAGTTEVGPHDADGMEDDVDGSI